MAKKKNTTEVTEAITPDEAEVEATQPDAGETDAAPDSGTADPEITHAAGDQPPADEASDTKDSTNPPKDEPTKDESKPVIEVKPHHVAFFEQFVELTIKSQPQQAIRALDNCFKAMLKADKGSVYSETLDMFKEHRGFLAPKVVLQSAASLSRADRAVTEIIVVIMKAIIEDPNTPINLDMARSVVKTEGFVTWAARALAKARR